MKKTLFGLLVVTLMFAFACDNKGGNNANNANNGGNTNANQNRKNQTFVPTHDSDTKTVTIIVTDDASLESPITVTPDPIRLTVNQKISWVFYNNRSDGDISVRIDSFVIDGTTTPDNPFKAGNATFDLGTVASGHGSTYPTGDDTTVVKPNVKPYKYTVHATVLRPGGTPTPLKDLDPRVVISQ